MTAGADQGMFGGDRSPILRVPPFPHAPAWKLARPGIPAAPISDDPAACLTALVTHRVGGSYWGDQPALPPETRTVARAASRHAASAMLAAAKAEGRETDLCFWLEDRDGAGHVDGWPSIGGVCDPWHILDAAAEIWCTADDELALLAAAAGRRLRLFGHGRFEALNHPSDGPEMRPEALREALFACARAALIDSVQYIDPFSEKSLSPLEAIDLLGFWRRLIDGNRALAGLAGIAFWKHEGVDALLWGGQPARFLTAAADAAKLDRGSTVALWKSRTSPALLAELEARDIRTREIEDGFIRSAGLGADCVPPFSVIVDTLGVHFDPSRTSDLEQMIERDSYSPTLIERAERLADVIVASGVSKYGVGRDVAARPAGDKRHVLVPGQVEDDRSVLCGGGDVAGNLDLLRRVRAAEPDAFIIYKPHPDVEAGHRKGHIPDSVARGLADSIVRDAPIAPLLDMVDAVHVLTSLAGFEALLRGKQVVTHGVPFYAGWGLTTDLGQIPARRTARPTLTRLIAAVLLVYPRYLDPVTRLPCPPEVLVQRLAAGAQPAPGVVVAVRRLHGRIRRTIARLGASA